MCVTRTLLHLELALPWLLSTLGFLSVYHREVIYDEDHDDDDDDVQGKGSQ